MAGSGQTTTAGTLTVGSNPAPGQDFWNIGATNAGDQSPTHVVAEAIEVGERDQPSSRRAVYLLLGLLCFVGLWFAYETFINHGDPIAKISELVASLMGEGSHEPTAAPATPTQAASTAPATPTTEAITTTASPKIEVMEGNPYWVLPNAILGKQAPIGRPWAPEEEEAFRDGIAHHFTYQRHKTVMDIRRQRLFGSEAVLWDALQDKKFWTRMYAAVGLAEFNVAVPTTTLEAALTGARSELVANFFERFKKSPNAGQLYIMRQALRLLDEKGRLVVLEAINRSDDKLRDLYMTAATIDPGPKVQKWLQAALQTRPIAPDVSTAMLAIVNGTSSGDHLIAGAKAVSEQIPDTSSTDTSSTPEEDVAQELKQFEENAGEVEFYDDATNTATDSADTDTFEYDEYEDAKKTE